MSCSERRHGHRPEKPTEPPPAGGITPPSTPPDPLLRRSITGNPPVGEPPRTVTPPSTPRRGAEVASGDTVSAREAARMLTEVFAESKRSRAPLHRERIVGASLVTVIRVTLSRGKDVTGDPVRSVTRYYDPDTGRLLAETDPCATTADRERFEVAAGIEGDHYDDRLWRESGA